MSDLPPSPEPTHLQPLEPSGRSLEEVEQSVPVMDRSAISHLIRNTHVQPISDASDDNVRKLEAEQTAVELLGRKQYFEIRRKWSRFLMWVMALEIVFQGALLIAVGLNWLNYMKYGSLIEIVVGSNFVQIISLVVIVVKYLFPHPDSMIPPSKTPKP